jgi:hypothetical protein
MRDIHQTLSTWARLWPDKHRQSDSSVANLREHPVGRPSAMEIELRAMNAKTDTAFNDDMAALKKLERSSAR